MRSRARATGTLRSVRVARMRVTARPARPGTRPRALPTLLPLLTTAAPPLASSSPPTAPAPIRDIPPLECSELHPAHSPPSVTGPVQQAAGMQLRCMNLDDLRVADVEGEAHRGVDRGLPASRQQARSLVYPYRQVGRLVAQKQVGSHREFARDRECRPRRVFFAAGLGVEDEALLAHLVPGQRGGEERIQLDVQLLTGLLQAVRDPLPLALAKPYEVEQPLLEAGDQEGEVIDALAPRDFRVSCRICRACLLIGKSQLLLQSPPPRQVPFDAAAIRDQRTLLKGPHLRRQPGQFPVVG